MRFNSLLVISSIVGTLLLLTACAKQSSAIVRNIAGGSSKPVYVDRGKFTLGPHGGLLDVRQYYFDCQSTLLPPQYQAAAKVQAVYLKANPQAQLELQGFADAGGSAGYNIAVADERAQSVSSYLQLQGVNKKQITTVTYGAAMDQPYSGRQISKNCRVDLVY